MSNRQTLMLLVVLTVLAGVGRSLAAARLSRYQEALNSHKKSYQFIAETASDLAYRRSKVAAADTEKGYQTHFQNQAFTAHMGSLTVQTQEKPQQNYVDKIFTITFEGDDKRFRRQQIVNFLYNSELLMPRMRTTVLTIQPAGPQGGRRRRTGVAPGVDREDYWRIGQLLFVQRTQKAKEEKKR